jgi:uncharacterized protein YecA (UPF0149 family)
VEQASRLLQLPVLDWQTMNVPPASESLASLTACQQEAILQSISRRNAAFFEAEANKLDGWAEDLKVGLEREMKELQFVGGDDSSSPQQVVSGAKVGRNDPCPCGSGKKYKKCHGAG